MTRRLDVALLSNCASSSASVSLFDLPRDPVFFPFGSVHCHRPYVIFVVKMREKERTKRNKREMETSHRKSVSHEKEEEEDKEEEIRKAKVNEIRRSMDSPFTLESTRRTRHEMRKDIRLCHEIF